MKKAGLIFSLMLICLAVMGVSAAPVDSGLLALAQYFPEDTPFFFAMRTDEAYIDEIDTILNQFRGLPFPEATDFPSVRDGLEMGLGEADLSLDDIYLWLGDSFAYGVTEVDLNGSDSFGYAVIQISERAAAEAFIETMNETHNGDLERSEQGEYTAYTTRGATIYVGDTIALIVDERGELPKLPLASSLVDNADFAAAAGELPADKYDMVGYGDLTIFSGMEAMEELEVFGMGADTLAPLMFGGTILDKYSLVIDAVQLTGETEVARIDPAFRAYIPTDASAVIHATDLTGLYNAVLDQMSAVAEATGETGVDPREQAAAMFEMVGIDLESDLLSWTTGDYVLFLRSDSQAIIAEVMANGGNVPDDVSENFDLGLVIEATDPDKAATFAAKVGTLVSTMVAREENITVAQEELEGAAITAITVTVDIDPRNTFDLEFVIGSNDAVFFMGTRGAAEAIFSGASGLGDSQDFQQAQQYILPEPTSIWYVDGEGLMVGVGGMSVGFLALMGPAIGNVFDEIIKEFDEPQTLYPQPMTVQNDDEVTQALDAIEYAMRLVGSASFSSTVTGSGATVTRVVLTFNPQ